jgi:hypothetical protein
MKRTTIVAAIAAAGAAALLFTGCGLLNSSSRTPSAADISSFQTIFMSSYFAERGGTPAGEKGLMPFGIGAGRTGARATVNTAGLANSSFASLSPTSFANYPEPGETTSFTISVKDAASHVYDVTATTTYPSTDIRSKYVEEYYVEDGNPTYGTAADGKWDANDPIVKLSGGAWTQDQAARVQQVLTFTDGTKRTETIVAQTRDWGLGPTNAPRFDPADFDINGSLDFSQLFYPKQTTDANVRFSSVVMYYVTPSTSSSYWFWTGTQAQTILGIRYYTESWNTATGTFTGYTTCFEKTLNTLTTTGGSFSSTLASVFVGSKYSALAESVLRQTVTASFNATTNAVDWSTAARTTNMKTRVVDVTAAKDFILTQMDEDAATWADWTTSTIYTPTATAQEVAAEEDSSKFLYARTLASASSVPLAQQTSTAAEVSGTGDLATLYTSISEGSAVVSTGTTIAGSTIIPAGQEWQFNGAQGKTVAYDPAAGWDLTTTGTVEAWVFINAQTDTGGIVHKGDKADFTDECYSLQFWGNLGQVAMIVDYAPPSYAIVQSTTNLNTGKWYYLVATWDATAKKPALNLYINGVLNKSVTSYSAAQLTAATNTSSLHVGAQLPVTYSTAYGYFGFNGKINGVKVSKTVASASTIAANYATYVTATSGW